MFGGLAATAITAIGPRRPSPAGIAATESTLNYRTDTMSDLLREAKPPLLPLPLGMPATLLGRDSLSRRLMPQAVALGPVHLGREDLQVVFNVQAADQPPTKGDDVVNVMLDAGRGRQVLGLAVYGRNSVTVSPSDSAEQNLAGLGGGRVAVLVALVVVALDCRQAIRIGLAPSPVDRGHLHHIGCVVSAILSGFRFRRRSPPLTRLLGRAGIAGAIGWVPRGNVPAKATTQLAVLVLDPIAVRQLHRRIIP